MDPSDIEIAAVAATHTAPLGADTVPDENQAHHCFSCEAPLRGLHCDACGQKNDDFRRSIFNLIREFVGSVTGLESRIWRTWGALLFKPGKVAREFADGKRTKWTSPVRAFLAMSIILFGYMSFTGTQLISIDMHPVVKDGVTKTAETLTDDDYRLGGGVYFFEGRRAIEARNKTTDYALLERMLKDKDTGRINLDIGTDDDEADTDDAMPAIPEPDMAPEINTIKFGNQEIDMGDSLTGLIKIIQDPQEVNVVFYRWLPRVMILMMPFSMFIGILFIRGRGNALMYDHLVQAAYIHAVLYFLVFVGIIISRQTPGAHIAGAIALGMLVYLPLSLKRMFGRGWFKTIWTTCGVGLIYLLTILLILLGLLIFGVVQSVGTLP